MLAGHRIDDRNRRRGSQARHMTGGCRSPRGHLHQPFTRADAFIRESLAAFDPAQEFNDLRVFGEGRMMQLIGRGDACQIDDIDSLALERGPVRLLGRINRAQPRLAPDFARKSKRAVITRGYQRKIRPPCAIAAICSRAISTSTSGAASMTLRIFSATLPSRIAIWRNASSVTQFPIEWARTVISPVPGLLARKRKPSSSASRE